MAWVTSGIWSPALHVTKNMEAGEGAPHKYISTSTLVLVKVCVKVACWSMTATD